MMPEDLKEVNGPLIFLCAGRSVLGRRNSKYKIPETREHGCVVGTKKLVRGRGIA